MNKLFTKVAALSVGLAMAIGVGVAVGGQRAPVRAKAAEGAQHAITGFTGEGVGTVVNNGTTPDDITITDQGYTVKQVIIGWKHNKNNDGITASVTIGGVSLGSGTVGGQNTTTTTTIGTGSVSLSGAVSITWSNGMSGTGKGTLYINTITLVEGSSGGGSGSVTSVTVSPATMELDLNGTTTGTVTPTVTVTGGASQAVTWSVENADPTGCVTVSNAGLVTAVAVGTADVKATSSADSTKSAVCEVTVIDTTPDDGYSDATMSGSSGYTVNGETAIKIGTSSTGGSMTIIVPSGATKLRFYAAAWNGDNSTILSATPTEKIKTTSFNLTSCSTISGSGKSYTVASPETYLFDDIGLKNISSETTITLSNSSKRFVVWGAQYSTESSSDIPVESVSVSPASATISIGGTTTLTETVLPSDATDKSVTWSSSNELIATVDSDGLVTGVDAGNATITVTTTDGDKTATSAITVSMPSVTTVTVAEALDIIDDLEDNETTTGYYKVTGYVTAVTTDYNPNFRNISFDVADSKGGTPTLRGYRVTCSAEVGATVIRNAKITMTGHLCKYVGSNTIPELTASMESQFEVLEPGHLDSLIEDGDSFIVYAVYNSTTYYLTGVSNNLGTCDTNRTNAAVFVAEEDTTPGQFALLFDDQYLSYSGSSNYVYTSATKGTDATLWKAYDNGSHNVLESVATSGRKLQYNHNNDTGDNTKNRFACYSSSQVAITIEKVTVVDPTTLTLDTKTMTLEQGKTSSTLTFTTDSPSATFNWASENTSLATVSEGAVTAVANSGNVKIYVWFDTDGSGDFDPAEDLNDYCTVTLTAAAADYSKCYGGTGIKVTSSNQSTLIQNGNKIILTYNDEYVAGEYESNKRYAASNNATFSNSTVTIGDGTSEITTVTVFELEASTNGYHLKLKDGKYLNTTSTTSSAGDLKQQDSASTEWVVTADGVYQYGNESKGTIRVNTSSNNIFKTYATTTGVVAEVYSFVEYTDEANTYAAGFMNSGLCGSDDNTKASGSIWASQSSAYSSLTAGAKYLLSHANANEGSSEIIERCVARYDRVMYLHYATESATYNDFMGRVSGGYVTPKAKPISILASGVDSDTTLIIVIASVVAVAAVGGYFFLRRKKEQ